MRQFWGQKTAKAARAEGAGAAVLGLRGFFLPESGGTGPEGRDQRGRETGVGAAWGRILTGAAIRQEACAAICLLRSLPHARQAIPA